MLDLSAEPVPDPADEVAGNALSERCQARLRYHPVPGGGTVHRVHGIAGTRRALAVVERPDDGFDTVFFDLPDAAGRDAGRTSPRP